MLTLFISDLHLDEARPEMTQAFLRLLKTDAIRADALYILGDFFEVWVGDDYQSPLTNQLMQGLQELASRGVPIYLMHGNRDFLMGKQFYKLSGCQFLKDPTVIDLYGTRTLLMHGDSLCTDDIAYMRLRWFYRLGFFRWTNHLVPLAKRCEWGQRARKRSQNNKRGKTEMMMDTNPNAIKQAMKKHNASLLIHGHTHKPSIEYLALNQQLVQKIVLSDWYQCASALYCYDNGERRLVYL